MIHTGVKIKPEELKRLKELADRAAHTPVIALSLAEGLSGNDWASRAWRNAQEACHALALQYGLPEIPGFYGLTNDGEFVRT